LGSPAAYYLASAGVASIVLVDGDAVDLTNLQRQILHTTERVGTPKAHSGQASLHAINPEVEVTPIARRVDAAALDELVQQATIVLDCSDNFATRHAINRACVMHRRPLVSGAAIRFDGQIAVFDLRADESPCYACLFPPASGENAAEDELCSTMGVFAPLTGIIGTMQAGEALKLAAGIGETLHGRLQMLDALTMRWHSVRVTRDPSCPVCAHH
jgi:molybdopterin/thiamine biosynthesis adenylyltransferase